ncbi:MAG: SDR family oxidoreductase [Acidobacteria bacterium]|nr:SDR family oxidoreductase [Acidobacteriota bacterium]
MKLKNRVAIVTGASQGIGRAAALELARNGADVTINYLSHPELAKEVAGEIESLGRRALLFHADVSDRKADEAMIGETARLLGSVDILVANAAYGIRKPFLELEVAEVEKTWAVSLWGVFHTCQLAAQQMVRQQSGGSLILISSVHAYRPFPNSSAYNAAKAAINQMAFTWAVELGCHQIRVNVIEPGWIDTPGERQTFTEAQIGAEAKKLLMGRLGTAEEIAKGVLFLASDEDSSYVTGACLRIDGGFVLPR